MRWRGPGQERSGELGMGGPCPPGAWGLAGAHHVGAQVNAEDGDSAQRQWDVGHDEQQEGCDLGDVAGQGVGDGLFQVVEDQAACGMRRLRPHVPTPGHPISSAPSLPRACVLSNPCPHPPSFPRACPTTSLCSSFLKIQPLWKPVWQFLLKLNIPFPFGPVILLLDLYPGETSAYVHQEASARIFTTVLVIIHPLCICNAHTQTRIHAFQTDSNVFQQGSV